MSQLLERLRAGSSVRGEARVGDIAFELRLLTEADYLEAGTATLEHFKAAGVEFGMASADLFEDEKSRQLLMRALYDPETSKAVFESPSLIRKVLTRDQKFALVEQYVEFEKCYSPSERNMDDAAFQALLDEVKKTPETARLNDSSSATLRRLITALAGQPSI